MPPTEYIVQDQERMHVARRYFRWQHQLAQQAIGSRILEVGCGVGNFTELLAHRELVVAVDSEPACIQSLVENLGARRNVMTAVMDITDPSFPELAKHRFDSVVCLNVLEHVQDDRLALANLAAVLPEGGKLVLIVPAFQGLYGPIDVRLAHCRRYSKRGLADLASSVGFETSVSRYMNFIGFFAWWFNARVTKRTKQSSFQIALFDVLIVPWMSQIERFVEPPVGQSIFAILTKQDQRD